MTPDLDPPAPRPRRRWLRLSLRASMALVLVGGGAAGWLAHTIRTQRQAVAAVKAVGGTVSYDWQAEQVGTRPNGRPLYRAEPTAPAWLRRVLGDELFQHVRTVYCGEPIPAEVLPGVLAAMGRFDRLEGCTLGRLADAGGALGPLRGLGRLQTVWLGGPGVTDAMLADLAAIPSLRHLTIGRPLMPRARPPADPRTSPTDAGFAPLAALRGLESLGIEDCPNVTDATLARLVAAMPKLRSFSLSGTTGELPATLAAIGRHPDLEGLRLDRTGVTDAELAAVAGLTRLRSFSLQNAPRVGDAGVAHLRGLQGLGTVLLSSTGVTDASLDVLGGLTNLEGLYLTRTRITDAGIARLAGLTKLHELAIGWGNLTDAAMPTVGRLASLERLDLDRMPALTDAGLVPLQALPKLQRLTITESRITPEGVAALQQAIPALTRVTTKLARPAAPPPPSPAPAAK